VARRLAFRSRRRDSPALPMGVVIVNGAAVVIGCVVTGVAVVGLAECGRRWWADGVAAVRVAGGAQRGIPAHAARGSEHGRRCTTGLVEQRRRRRGVGGARWSLYHLGSRSGVEARSAGTAGRRRSGADRVEGGVAGQWVKWRKAARLGKSNREIRSTRKID